MMELLDASAAWRSRHCVCPAALTLSVALSGCSEVSNNPHPLGSGTDQYDLRAVPRTVAQIPRPDQLVLERRDAGHVPGLRAAVRLSLPEAPLRARRTRRREEIARPRYLDKDGKELPDDAPGELIAESVLDIKIKPGIMYAPHPAFAKDAQGDYVYHDMKREDVADKYKITDFKQTGTRELTADDYVYGIRRLATPRIKSPSFSTMSDYIVGLKEYGDKIVEADKALRRGPGADRPRPAVPRFPQVSVRRRRSARQAHAAHPREGQVPAVQVLAGDDVLLADPVGGREVLLAAGHGREEPDDELLAGRHRARTCSPTSSRTAATCWSAIPISTAKPIRARASAATRRRATWPIAASRCPSSTRSCSTSRRKTCR